MLIHLQNLIIIGILNLKIFHFKCKKKIIKFIKNINLKKIVVITNLFGSYNKHIILNILLTK